MGRVLNAIGRVEAAADVPRNDSGDEVHVPLLASAVRYVHTATDVPIIAEQAVGTSDDAIRARRIPEARYGRVLVDPTTFVRTPKPSLGVPGAIARQNRN